jgi:hypothetical protein
MTEYQEGIIRLAMLEVAIMPNNEIICAGKHIGWMNEKVPSWFTPDAKLGDFISEGDTNHERELSK